MLDKLTGFNVFDRDSTSIEYFYTGIRICNLIGTHFIGAFSVSLTFMDDNYHTYWAIRYPNLNRKQASRKEKCNSLFSFENHSDAENSDVAERQLAV